MNKFFRFVVVIGLTLTILVGAFKQSAYAYGVNTIYLHDTSISNGCGNEPLNLVDVRSGVSDIQLYPGSPAYVPDFNIKKVIWRQVDYYPKESGEIPQGYIGLFQLCNEVGIVLTKKRVNGGEDQHNYRFVTDVDRGGCIDNGGHKIC
ncbi:hypothetical protein [uncultured Nostoc sp.]|uniref:hypothetical protein n=1 Tax=uncultured Nostoc sp. TaxID=340711 RepID=UPI0035CB0051